MSNSILENLTYDPDQGRIAFKDVRYLLIRPETLRDFQKAVEAELGREKVAEMMLQGGLTGGRLSSKRYREVFGYSDQQIVEFMVKMGSEIGWGKFSVEKFDPAKGELVVQVASSPFAAVYGQSDTGVCHLIRGVLAGLAEGIFGRAVTSTETHCLAKGDAHCRFAIRAA